jgi:hypothetical protein
MKLIYGSNCFEMWIGREDLHVSHVPYSEIISYPDRIDKFGPGSPKRA